MLPRKSLSFLVCTGFAYLGLAPLAGAADHRASIHPAGDGAGVSIESPIIGYFNSPTGLVAVEGITSAAHARSLAPAAADRIVLPPGQRYEWLERAGTIYTMRLPDSSLKEVPGAWAGADLIAFNTTATAAVLFAAGKMQVIGGLPDSPHVLCEVAAPGNDIISVAISDDSAVLAANSSAGVFTASEGGDWRLVMPASANALAFVPQSRDTIVALSDQVYLLKDAATAQWLAAATSPSAVAASDDGRLAVVLNASGKEALLIDLQSGSAARLPLGAVAKDLQRGRDGVLMFIPPDGVSPWLLDTRSGVLSFAPELPAMVQGR